MSKSSGVAVPVPTGSIGEKPGNSSKTPEVPSQLERDTRLQARIDVLRSKRKAHLSGGAIARNCQELTEVCRNQDLRGECRRAPVLVHKEMEAKAIRHNIYDCAAIIAPISTSNKHGVADIGQLTNTSFGKIMFSDGQELNDSLRKPVNYLKCKGPADILGQLKKIDGKTKRLTSMPEEKRKAVAERDMWSKALKQARGVKVNDNKKLLKRSLKRMEKTKKRSESAW